MMINNVDVSLLIDGKETLGTVVLKKDSSCLMTLLVNGEVIEQSQANDFFSCLCGLRDKVKNITFLCKGAKKNVYPSRMARQMANGIKAYELTWGKQADRGDLVGIFDYEVEGLVSPDEQKEYFDKWVSSLGE
ncbi:hypothetical protein [Pectobacterium quasiaquaticum]|uniref:hypothetical protein n=1 Tax=Pectobacterium quasiaquaticum TaxID=2774015 RepID=UPI001CF7B49D|nr:hypothetical protein [Pectobacterium quasiaquaticum]